MDDRRAWEGSAVRGPPGVLRSGRDGVWWERGDGLQVRLAAPETGPRVERVRLSLLAMLLAYAASDGTAR